MIAVVLPWICYIAQAQTDTTLKPTDKFGIPEYNSSISFATSGTYERASLENGTWNFVNLRLNNSQLLEKLTLRVSAQDSNVTITSYRTFNTTIGGVYVLGYNVTGQGNQTFNFGLNPIGGDWGVIFNGVFMVENDGWRVSPDATLTITGATANVTILYYSFPDSFGGNGNSSNQPIYQQHSVAIITAVAVAITVILTIAIRRKNKELLS
jgi:hypothetical protein